MFVARSHTGGSELGSALDEFVERTLSENPASADWSSAAKRLSPHLPERTGEPLSRIFDTSFGRRSHARIGDESQTLVDVGMYAAQVLGGLLPSLTLSPPRMPTRRGHPAKGRMEASVRYAISDLARRIVVYHGKGGHRRSVLVLDPELPMNTPPAVLPAAALGNLILEAGGRLGELATADLVDARDDSDAIEALWIARPRVIVAPQPPLEYTCVSRPAPTVVCAGRASTAGAWATDKSGTTGITVCYHGTGPSGTKVAIGGVDRVVTHDSEVVDSCFVAVPASELPPSSSFIGRRGVLQKRAPGAQERHTFWASSGSVKDARIVGVDYGVPVLTPHRQLCVYTDPVTNYGDSGGALVNDDDQLVGFSFQRTPFGSPSEFSTWLWAPAVFINLDLKPHVP